MPKIFDYSGRTFNNITVLSLSHKREKDSARIWNCSCSCGKMFKRKVNIKILLKRKYCKYCKPILEKEAHGSWKAEGDISGRIYALIKCSAKSKNLLFSVSKRDLWELYLKQDKKCQLSGVEIKINSQIKLNKSKGSASLDRIDSSRGYSIDNVQWVHRDVNLMKRDLSQEKFIEYCNKISTINKT